MLTKDLVIIGGGSAGLAAAIGAYDNGVRDILVIEKGPFLGGILNQCIHNGFGLTEFKEELTGPEFASRFIKQAEEREIECLLNSVVTDVTCDKVVTFVNKSGTTKIKAKAIVMAAGCYERSAGAISLPGDRPSGVINAGQAQLYLNEHGLMCGKRVFILGSGDIGLIMARRLTLEGAKVLGVAELCAWSNGLNRNMVQCLDDYGIPLYLSHTVTNVIGKSRLEKIVISKVDENNAPIEGTEKEFEVDTLILSVGLIPNNILMVKAGAEIARNNGCLVNDKLETSIPGIYSCGNVLHVHDLVDNVVEEAREAGKNAAKYILGNEESDLSSINTKAGEGIGYVVPARIVIGDREKDTTLKFRVRKPSKDVYILFEQNGKILKKMFKPAIIPSEMEIVKLSKELLENGEDLVIKMVKKEAK